MLLAWEYFETFESIYKRFFPNSAPVKPPETLARDSTEIAKIPTSNKAPKPKIETSKFEVSIQLETSDGYRRIFLNGKEIHALASSTPFNPRVLVTIQENVPQEIVLITESKDTCYLNNIFDRNLIDNPPPRFIPKCLN